MKSYFVDFEATGCGVVTTYVKATNESKAVEAIKKYAVRHNGLVEVDGAEEVFIGVVRVYEIDEVPADCAYLDEEGCFSF